MPLKIVQLIDGEKIIDLCKIGKDLSKQQILAPALTFLENVCKAAIDDFIKSSNNNQDRESEFIIKTNKFVGNKLTNLLNMDAFRKHVFNGNVVTYVDPNKNILKYKNSEGEEFTKFMSEYSTGERAFAFSMANIFNAMTLWKGKNTFLVLDEFGAMLAEDKESFLIESLNRMQSDSNWPTQYVIILPYKGEFNRREYKEKYGEKIKEKVNDLKERGYTFEELP